MPLIPIHEGSFEKILCPPDRKAEYKKQDGKKILTLYNEENYQNVYHYSDATHIIISDQLDHIEGYVFAGFAQLRQVTIPNSVTFIGYMAFSHCESLTDIILPDSIEWIGGEAFACCTSLKSVRLPDGITEIDRDAFRRCTSLKEIFLPPSVQCIREDAFADCESLEAVYGGEGLIAIEADAFSGCKKLRRFPWSSGVCSIAKNAFADAPICPPATYFGPVSPRAAYGRSVVVPDGVQTIGAFAFSARKAPISVTLPDSVRNISREAFIDGDYYESEGYDGRRAMIGRWRFFCAIPSGRTP